MTTATQAAIKKVNKQKKSAKVSHAKPAESENLKFPVPPEPEYGLMPINSIIH